MRTFSALAALCVALIASGCGNDSKTDLANGKTLFVEKCGACHQMARAGTNGTIGPNLDDAFRQARRDGMATTIEGVTLEQIKWPSQKLYPPELNMPKDIVTGLDAKDVAAYVAYAAAAPGKDGPELPEAATDGPGLFKTNCGSCHTLADAGTAGTAGPPLDGLKLNLAQITTQIENGGNGMPAFAGTLSPEEIKLIAEYLDEQ
jgi:cbb3-type cytochrome c oxidase subunit III